MPANALITRAALAAYSFAHRSGLLRCNAFKSLFEKSYFAYKRLVEDPTRSLLAAHPELVRGGWVLDVGANIGYTASVFAHFLSDGQKVVAFEPDLENFTTLQGTIAARRLDEKVVAIRAAVGAEAGSIDLWLNQDHHADHRVLTSTFRSRLPEDARVAKVPMVSIDDFMQTHPEARVAFIKIDVQGYELEVCRGMTATLDTHPAAVVFEYSPPAMRDLGNDPRSLTSFFTDRGFRLHVIGRRGALSPVTAEELEALGREYLDVLAVRS